MSDEVLRDSHGRRIGVIRKSGTKLVLYDAHNHRLGVYDPANNVTYDAHNHRVGTGNLLTTLL